MAATTGDIRSRSKVEHVVASSLRPCKFRVDATALRGAMAQELRIDGGDAKLALQSQRDKTNRCENRMIYDSASKSELSRGIQASMICLSLHTVSSGGQ